MKWKRPIFQGDLISAFALLFLLWLMVVHQIYYPTLYTSVYSMGYQMAQASGGDGKSTGDSGPVGTQTDPQGLADGAHALFVDQSNSACSDTVSRSVALDPATPWCTPRGINQGLQSGDTVYIKGGLYLLSDITATNRILVRGVDNVTIQAYPGNSVTIAGSTATMSGCAPGGICDDNTIITFYQVNGLKIEDITFRGYVDGPSGRLYIPHMVSIGTSSNVEIRDSKFLDYQGSDDIGYGQRGATSEVEGWGHSLRFHTVDGVIVDGIRVRGIEDPSKLIPDRYGGDGLICDNCRNVEVSDSEFLDTAHISLNFRNSSNVTIKDSDLNNRLHTSAGIGSIAGNAGVASNFVFEGNRFFGHNQFMSQPVGTGLRGGGLQIGPGTISDVLVANNLFYNGYNDSTGLTVGSGANSTISNIRVYYNTFYRPGSRAIYLSNNLEPGSNAVDNVKIKNNLIYQVKQQAGQNTGYAFNREIVLIAYNFEENNGYGTEIKNNLIVPFNNDGAVVASAQLSGNGQIPVRYTYTVDQLNTKNFAGANLNLEPPFDSPQSGDFRLTASTTAMYAGECLDEVTKDYANKSRDNGSGCTVGAYEYDLELPAVPIPPKPTASPPSGVYDTTRQVSLTSAGAAAIRYNMGSGNVQTPSCSNGTVYSGPITISTSAKIRAVACNSVGGKSASAYFTYTIGADPLNNEQGGEEAPPPPAPLNNIPAPGQPLSPELLQILLQLFGLGGGTATSQPLAVTRVLQINRDLTLGATGDDVVALQNYLINRLKGPRAQSLGMVGATGTFGPLTAAALAEYQSFVGISPATGYFGTLTRSYLARAWSQ